MKKVILEGCNGDWSQKHYLPFLVEKALEGNIELWAVDVEPQIKTVPRVTALWQKAQREAKACYLDKSSTMGSYEQTSDGSYVFVVAPARVHSEIATFWLERLAPEGKIFIEKPLDANLSAALTLKEKIEEKGKKEAVFGFDHYLARAYPFLQDSSCYLEQIGSINKIESHLLEDSKIPHERKETLDKGIVFDLFCHVLALVNAVVKQNTDSSETKLQEVKLKKVKGAQYKNSPIPGETFALIKFIVNGDIEVVSAIGNCVGTSDDKIMRLYGSSGEIKLDFVEDMFFVFDSQGRQRKQGRLNSKHVESFLSGVLAKKEPLSIPGVLSFDTAFKILEILDEAKNKIDKMFEYQCNDPLDKILEILEEREIQ